MPTRRRSASSSRRTKIRTVWQQTNFTHTQTPVSSQQITDISHQAIMDEDERTGKVLRVIGNITVTPQVGTAPGDYNFAAAISVASENALTGSRIPGALNASQQDWYYWTSWEGELSSGGTSNHTVYFDIRTARVLREGYRLVWNSQNAVQELGSNLFVRLRTLWSMP